MSRQFRQFKRCFLVSLSLQGVGPGCGPKSVRSPLSESDRNLIVDLHNQLRSKIANGKEGTLPTGFPPAADMMELVWDNEVISFISTFTDSHRIV